MVASMEESQEGEVGLPYNRRTAKNRWVIGNMKVYRQFFGWKNMIMLVKLAKVGLKGHLGETLIHNQQEQNEAGGLIATVFENGMRIGEALGTREKDQGLDGIRVNDIKSDGEVVNAIFQIEKRYRKVGGKVTKYKATDGTFLRWNILEEAEASGKSFEEYEGYNTKRVPEIRNIEYSAFEPLVPIMLEWIEMAEDLGWKQLFNFS